MIKQIAEAATYLLRRWKMSATIVFVLALGISCTAAIFAAADALLMKKLPIRDPDRLLFLQWSTVGALPDSLAQGEFEYPAYRSAHDMHRPRSSTSFSYRTFESFAKRTDVFESAFGFAPIGKAWYGDGTLSVLVDGRGELLRGDLVTGAYFSSLGVDPVVGRVLAQEDAERTAAVAVISHRYWSRRFASRPDILSESLTIGGVSYAIVGVARRGFEGLVDGMPTDFWVPLSDRPGLTYWGQSISQLKDPQWWGVTIAGRLKAGVTRPQALATLQPQLVHGIAEYVQSPPPADQLPTLGLIPAAGGLAIARTQLILPLRLLAVFGLAMVFICCVNGGTLLLERGIMRRGEIATRVALGASRVRIWGQLSAEGMLIVLAAAVLGLVGAVWATRLLSLQLAGVVRPLGLTLPEARIDARVVGFTVVVAAVTVIGSTLLSLWISTRAGATGVLRTNASQVFRVGRHWFTRACVLVQLSVSVALLVIALVFVRSAHGLLDQDLGFSSARLLVFSVTPRKAATPERNIVDEYLRLQSALERVPGLSGVTSSVLPPVSERGAMLPVTALLPGAEPQRVMARVNLVGPRFFETLGIPVVMGRGVDARDVRSSGGAAVPNREFVKQVFGETSPLGQTIRIPGVGNYTVIGVAENAVYESVYEAKVAGGPKALLYLPYAQLAPNGFETLYFMTQVTGAAARVLPALSNAIQQFDPTMAVGELSWQHELIERSVWREATTSHAASLAGLLFLLVAGISVAATLWYMTAERGYEFAVRAALGASRPQLFWVVLSQGLWGAAIATAVGLPAALAVARWLSSRMIGLQPPDALAFIVPVVVIATAVILAGAGPAYKACRADPRAALVGQ
jgi:predicted permease